MEVIQYQFKRCDKCKKVVYTDEKYCHCSKILKVGYKLITIEDHLKKGTK